MIRKIGFYYTHYQCLGHTTRLISLVDCLREKNLFSFYFIQGSHPYLYLRFPSYIKLFLLPYPLFNRKSFFEDFVLDKYALVERAKYLLSIIKSLKPFVFVTEFFPFGRNLCKYELLPTLTYLKRENKIIFSSCGYAIISRKSLPNLEILLPFYNKIFIHSPYIEIQYISDFYKAKSERHRYLDIFKKYANKIIFTGYILPSQLNFKRNNNLCFNKGKVKILITRGAGAYYPEIISTSIRTSELLGKGFHFIIIAGPSTSQKEWEYFQVLIKKKTIKNVSLVRYVSNLKELIKDCDLCISTSSYNTSVLLMYFNKNSIVIPFRGYKGNEEGYIEQPSRANLLRDFLGTKVIDYFNLTPTKLKKEIERKLNGKHFKNRINKNWFKGKTLFFKEFLSSVT